MVRAATGAPIAGRDKTLRDLLIRTFLKIRGRDGRLIPLRPNAAQRAYSEKRRGGHDIILKARQLGFTTYIAARFFIATITRPGTLSVSVAHDLDSRKRSFRSYGALRRTFHSACARGVCRRLAQMYGSWCSPRSIVSFGSSRAADENCGRGSTNPKSALLGSGAVAWRCGSDARFIARVLLRIAGSDGAGIHAERRVRMFLRQWQRAGETGAQQHFFRGGGSRHIAGRSYRRKRLRTKNRNCRRRMAYRRNKSHSGARCARAFAVWLRRSSLRIRVAAFLASGDCVFDLEMIAARLNGVLDPSQIRDNGRLQMWFEPLPEREYIIGCDPAGGGANGDYACAQVIDRASGLQCAELRGHWPPREFAARIAELGREYNHALLAVEQNNHGHGVLAHLTDRYSNLYCQREQPGWNTTTSSRPRMIETFPRCWRNVPDSSTAGRCWKNAARSSAAMTDPQPRLRARTTIASSQWRSRWRCGMRPPGKFPRLGICSSEVSRIDTETLNGRIPPSCRQRCSMYGECGAGRRHT